MAHLELEVKVLDIDVAKLERKLKKLGAKKIEEVTQVLYTYDLPTIYGRYLNLKVELNHPTSSIKYDVALEKYQQFAFEVDNLIEDKEIIQKLIGRKTFMGLERKKNFLSIFNSEELDEFFSHYWNNEKKWIRLRRTNDRVTLAVKHILAPNHTALEQMKEIEIEVSSMEEANQFLEAIGLVHKSYQEKRRITYELEGHEMDIDFWPEIPPYMEIEGNSEEDLKHILSILGYTLEDCVSCTADKVYEMYGKSHFSKRELRF